MKPTHQQKLNKKSVPNFKESGESASLEVS